MPEAVTVLTALISGFGTDDDLGTRTRSDLDTCLERLAAGQGTPEIRRLERAINAAVEQELSFQQIAMCDGRKTAQTPPVVAELYDAFSAAAKAAQTDLPWLLLRAFTLRLHNEFSTTEAALSFAQLSCEEATRSTVAAEILPQLQTDIRTLHKMSLNVELETAVNSKQSKTVRRLLEMLVTVEDDAEHRNKYQVALRTLRRQQIKTWARYGFYSVLAGLSLIGLITSNQNTSSVNNRSGYTYQYNAPAAPPLADPDAGQPQRQPAPGTTVLTRAELRWCRYQGARAQAARDYLYSLQPMTAGSVAPYNAGVHAYNAFIGPLNAVCTDYKYGIADGSVVEFEIAQKSDLLKAEGQRIITSAYQVDSTFPIGSPPYNRNVHLGNQNSTPDYAQPTPPSTLPSYPAPSSQQSNVGDMSSYSQGQLDRRNWEAWFAQLEGPFRDGAQWWASVRSSNPPPTCQRAPGADHIAAAAGCTAAQERLTNLDRRRRSEPDYRAGWNNP